MKFAVIEPFSGALAGFVGATSPTVFHVLQRDSGLKLEAGRALVDSWIIDQAEKPSAN